MSSHGSNSGRVRQPTRVRRIVELAKRWRYRMVYQRVLREAFKSLAQARDFKLDRSTRSKVKDYWRGFGIRSVNLNWYRLYHAMVGRVDPSFIPEDTFFTEIEPLLNDLQIAPAYSDKNMLDRTLGEFPRPTTRLRNIHGRFFDGSYNLLSNPDAGALLSGLEGDYIVKPAVAYTGGGHGIQLLTVRNGRPEVEGRSTGLEDFTRRYSVDFLIQDRMRQLDQMAAYHPNSVNTIRIISLRLGNEYHVICGTFRMGNGSFVDNGHSGGLLCGIDVETGQLTDFAVDVMYRRFNEHPMTKLRFKGQVLPYFEEVKSLSREVHERALYLDQLSFDIAIAEDGKPFIIEVNSLGQGVEPHQCLKGRSLYAPYTGEVLALVKERREAGWVAR